jgi:hypothetical protein
MAEHAVLEPAQAVVRLPSGDQHTIHRAACDLRILGSGHLGLGRFMHVLGLDVNRRCLWIRIRYIYVQCRRRKNLYYVPTRQ